MRLVPDGERVDVAADPDVTDASRGCKASLSGQVHS